MAKIVDLKRIWLTLGWCGVIAVSYLSLTPRPLELPMEQGDKLQHFAAYGTLMLWFAQLHIAKQPRRALAMALIAMGVGLECAQLMVSGRVFSGFDILANVVGVVFGWMIAPPRTKNLYEWMHRRTLSNRS